MDHKLYVQKLKLIICRKVYQQQKQKSFTKQKRLKTILALKNKKSSMDKNIQSLNFYIILSFFLCFQKGPLYLYQIQYLHYLFKYNQFVYLQQYKIKQSGKMQVLQFLTGKKIDQLQPTQFAPTINISPNSTLFIQCSPSDPHTASNIVINSYPSKTNRVNLQTRIQWKRFKILSDSDHTNTLMPFTTGNAYRCQPADLGYYIHAKISSFDVAFQGTAQVTIGPIRLDPTVKQLIEGALYSRSLRSQIKVEQKNQNRDVDMLLSDRTIRLIDNFTNKQLQMPYDLQQPKIQVNPKDPTKIFLRFQKDQNNKVRQWLDCVFEKDSSFDNQSKKSFNSQGSGSLKNRVFKSSGSTNKIQVTFLTRHSRDQFIFSLRAFVCKQNIKNTIAIQSIENVTQMRTPADTFKFFQYMSMKTQIYRLSELAKNLENDRDNKLKDLIALQQSVAQTTNTYVQLLKKKGQEFQIKFNQSYTQISGLNNDMGNKKAIRKLQQENKCLKQNVQQLTQQLNLKQFYSSNKNNQNSILNQTKNPFGKKSSDFYYGPSTAFQQNQKAHKQSVNFVELLRSHANLIKQNQKLKQQRKMYIAPTDTNNVSNNQSLVKDIDMLNLLQFAMQLDQQPTTVIIQRLKMENKTLKQKNQQLLEQVKRLNKTQVGKLNQSIAYQQQQSKKQISYVNQSQSIIDNNSRQGSFFSNMNDSMTSQAALMALQNKVQQIRVKNKEILSQNQRLRSQRNKYRTQYEKLKAQSDNTKKNTKLISPFEHITALSTSNNFDSDNLKQQNERLTNQRNSLRQKIESLIKQKQRGVDNLFEKKCEQLTKQNNFLRTQNESLRQKISSMKNQSKVSDNSSIENYKENDKLKKTISQLLEQIKNLKLQMQRKASPLYNSRVLQLENQVNFLKNAGQRNQGVQKATQQLLNQITRLQKDVQILTRQNNDKQAKLVSQARVIERFMNSQLQQGNSFLGKDKSYSETRNQSESNQKLKKKIKQLQQQIVMMRRSTDALNRSQDMSRDMISYYEQQADLHRQQKQSYISKIQNLAKMCQKYGKDARQATKQLIKLRQQNFQLRKNQKQQSIII